MLKLGHRTGGSTIPCWCLSPVECLQAKRPIPEESKRALLRWSTTSLLGDSFKGQGVRIPMGRSIFSKKGSAQIFVESQIFSETPNLNKMAKTDFFQKNFHSFNRNFSAENSGVGWQSGADSTQIVIGVNLLSSWLLMLLCLALNYPSLRFV